MRIENLRNGPAGMKLLVAMIASAVFAAIWFSAWPTDLMWDDGAIVLRYMDNFADGHFYRYNVADPPVFGVSGFIHCTLAGFVAASGWISPQDSLYVSGYVGLVLSCVAIFLILGRFTDSLIEIAVASVFSVSACYFLLANAWQGLESSLHLGIVLMACWSFLTDRWRAMWFLMALSIVSKLDATPVVAVLLVLRAASLRSRSEWTTEIRRAALWGGILLLAWILFSTWYFGSPFPQSAAAKVQFHYHPPDRLDFVRNWWRWDPVRIVVYWVSTAGAAVWAIRKRRDLARLLVLPLGCLAVLGLYLIYNPGERMPWYYVMPQALLVLGAVCGFLSVVRDVRRIVAMLIVVLALGATVPTTISRVERRVRGDINWIRDNEPKRIAVGQFIHDRAAADERLLTGWGYIARYARIHTHDLTGLNSPEVTRLQAENAYLPDALQPEWIAHPWGLSWETQRSYGYRLEHVFYDRAASGETAWRVWRRAPGEFVLPVARGDVLVGEVTKKQDHVSVSFSQSVRLLPRADFAVVACAFGIVRHDVPIRVVVSNPGVKLEEREFDARDPDDPVNGATGSIRVDLPDPALPMEVRVTSVDGASLEDSFDLLEPIWLIANETGAR
jgi:hypothetical protein